MTLTQTLRAGILASGWERTQTPSGRECYTKMCNMGKRDDSGNFVKISEAPMWLWLGEAGSVRWAGKNAVTLSTPVGRGMKARLEAAGKLPALGAPKADSAALLAQLPARADK